MLELGYPTNSADSKLQMSWQIKFCHDPFITLTDVFLRPDHSFEGWGYFHTAASETVNPHPSAVFPSHALVSPSENLACPVKISLCTRTNNLNCIQKKKKKKPTVTVSWRRGWYFKIGINSWPSHVLEEIRKPGVYHDGKNLGVVRQVKSKIRTFL